MPLVWSVEAGESMGFQIKGETQIYFMVIRYLYFQEWSAFPFAEKQFSFDSLDDWRRRRRERFRLFYTQVQMNAKSNDECESMLQ